MSTKIYNGLRVKDRDGLWPLLREIRIRGQQEVVNRMRAYYVDQLIDVDPESTEYKAERAECPGTEEVGFRLGLAQKKMREGFKASRTSPYRDFFDPDVYVTVLQHSRAGYLMRFFCDRVSMLGGSLDFLLEHPGLEDFHYQDQTNGPEEIPEADWDFRRQVWDDLMSPAGVLEDELILEICNYRCYWQLDPWLQLRKEYRENPPTLPLREEVLAGKLSKMGGIQEALAVAGHITAATKAGVAISIERIRKGSRKNQWVSKIGDHAKVHRSLLLAFERVEYEYLEPQIRRSVDRMIKESKDRRKELRKKQKRAT